MAPARRPDWTQWQLACGQKDEPDAIGGRRASVALGAWARHGALTYLVAFVIAARGCRK